MKYISTALAAIILSAAAAHASPVITFTAGGSIVPGTVIENFDEYAAGQVIAPGTAALTTSDSTAVRPAFGSSGNYAAVFSGGSYTIMFGEQADAFSFELGSLDGYNTLTLGFSDGTSIAYVGSQITGGGQADGNQTSIATNGVVSFVRAGGPKIISANFTSSQDSFEFDNLAISTPEPATWALMIIGFGLVGAAMRRRTIGGGYLV